MEKNIYIYKYTYILYYKKGSDGIGRHEQLRPI